jgi:hypothetical protein
MKKLFWASALLLVAAVTASAQTGDSRKYATLLHAFDLDGEAADADQVVEAAGGVIVDNGTSVGGADYTITAQPDSCRLHVLTISDTDMVVGAGTITVTGTGCLNEPRVCTWSAWTAGDDDGAKTLVCSDGEGAYFKSITSITTGTMTAESDEYFLLGYTANSVNGWAMYGALAPEGPNNEQRVDPFSSYDVPGLPITTSGADSTTITAVSTNAAFTNVTAGDLLLINFRGSVYERKVTAKASANSITVNQAINLPAAGVPFRYKKLWFSTNPDDEMAIPVAGYDTAIFNWSVDANANTGGVVTLLQCIDQKGPDWGTAPWVQLATTTVASAGTQNPTTESIDLSLLPYQYCRFGLKFGTGDDADAADEDVNLSVVLVKK